MLHRLQRILSILTCCTMITCYITCYICICYIHSYIACYITCYILRYITCYIIWLYWIFYTTCYLTCYICICYIHSYIAYNMLNHIWFDIWLSASTAPPCCHLDFFFAVSFCGYLTIPWSRVPFLWSVVFYQSTMSFVPFGPMCLRKIKTLRNLAICWHLGRGDWGALRVRCAAHRSKIRARVRCAMCTCLH